MYGGGGWGGQQENCVEKGSNMDKLLFNTTSTTPVLMLWCNAVLLILNVSEGCFCPLVLGFNKDYFHTSVEVKC